VADRRTADSLHELSCQGAASDQAQAGGRKSRNGEVAQAMEWAEIETIDLGDQIEDFLKF
jgi:hypothetical protein